MNDKNTKKALGNSRKKKKISKNKQGKEKVLLKDLIYCKHWFSSIIVTVIRTGDYGLMLFGTSLK